MRSVRLRALARTFIPIFWVSTFVAWLYYGLLYYPDLWLMSNAIIVAIWFCWTMFKVYESHYSEIEREDNIDKDMQ